MHRTYFHYPLSTYIQYNLFPFPIYIRHHLLHSFLPVSSSPFVSLRFFRSIQSNIPAEFFDRYAEQFRTRAQQVALASARDATEQEEKAE